MAKYGRKSAAELSVVTSLDARRPPPPDELTEEQKGEWRSATGAMPPGWFTRESFPVLAAYCRHVCRSRWLATKIDEHAERFLKVDGGVQLLDKMLAMAERESRAVLALARSMRLTQQARIDKLAAGRHAGAQPDAYSIVCGGNQ
jgi:hypothetical protein